jgi:hypothetical protein
VYVHVYIHTNTYSIFNIYINIYIYIQIYKCIMPTSNVAHTCTVCSSIKASYKCPKCTCLYIYTCFYVSRHIFIHTYKYIYLLHIQIFRCIMPIKTCTVCSSIKSSYECPECTCLYIYTCFYVSRHIFMHIYIRIYTSYMHIQTFRCIMPINTCTVCSSNKASYKCPKCRSVYCSIQCNKVHKSSCSSQPEG